MPPFDLAGFMGAFARVLGCAALIFVARRLTVLRVRSYRFSLAAAAACAATLWIGALPCVAGALLIVWAETRFLAPDRSARIAALRNGFAVASAALAGAAVRAHEAALPISTPALQQCVASLKTSAPCVAVFLCGFAAASFAADLALRSRRKRRRVAPTRVRIGVTLAGFVPLLLVVPFHPLFGIWSLAPLAVLLTASGCLIHYASEIARLRKQLSVSQAMGLASLADAATAEPTALLYRFLQLAQNLVQSDRSLVWMITESTDEIIPAAGLPDMGEFAGIRAHLGEGLLGTAAERTRPLIVSDAARTGRRSASDPAADSWLLFPIVSQKRVLGVAHWIRGASNPFTTEDAAQLEALVPQVGVAVESLRSRNRMRELASTDGLTGLMNHRRAGELLRDEMRRAERYNRPLSVLMMDVDSFKSFNDTYGHVAGDQLLRSVAQLLRTGVRTVDRVGRYGGEEFVIIMPETHKDDAYLLAERIRGTIEQQAFVVVAGEEIHRTVSVGVASYPEDGLNPQEVVERADEALYRAKNSGKNCVVWA